MRPRAVTAASADLNRKILAESSSWPGSDPDLTHWRLRINVKGDDCLNAFKRPKFNDFAGAASHLFRGLKDTAPTDRRDSGAVQSQGCSKQNRRVGVVTAGVHYPCFARTVSGPVHFLDREGIDVGAERDDRCRRI